MHEETRRLARFFFKQYPVDSVIATALLALAGFAESFGVLTLVPVLEVADAGQTSAQSETGRLVAQGLGVVGLPPTLPILLGLVFVAILVKSGLAWFGMRQVGFATASIVRDLRKRLMMALLEARWSHFGKQHTGTFGHALGGEAIAAASSLREGWAILGGLFPLAMYAVVAAMISWQTSLFAALSGFLLLSTLRGFLGASRDAGRQFNVLANALYSNVVDILQGLKPIKAMAKELLVWPVLADDIDDLRSAEMRGIRARENLTFFHEPIITGLLALGILLLFGIGDQPLSSVVVLAFVFYRMMQSIKTIQMRYQVLVTNQPAFWSLVGKVEAAERAREIVVPGTDHGPLTESITFEDVCFSYGETSVLRHVSFSIVAGRFVAIHGESGSGKTTLADLIAGLHTPGSGRILVDGRPLADLDLAAWRRRIGYVPQDMLLLSGSIADNVTLGDASIDRGSVERALRMAGAWAWVDALPDGIDTAVGERGAKLSGGQRQRVAIARALVDGPSLLILDEVTTALDPATEAEICETLRQLAGPVTILAISHQHALRRVADQIFVMKRGALVRSDSVSAD